MTPPVRVQRKGPLKWFHPTRDELKLACVYAESEARAIRFESEEKFTHWLAWCIGEQLGCALSCTIAGYHDVNDVPVVMIQTEHYTHMIVVREVTIKPPVPLAERAKEKVAETVGGIKDVLSKKRR